MAIRCPRPRCSDPENVRWHGFFRRRSDGAKIQRYFCLSCSRSFSTATSSPCFLQKKRQINNRLRELLCSSVSQRRCARILKVHRTTIARRLIFLGKQAQRDQETLLRAIIPNRSVQVLQMDELETFEHTKCKPLSVALCVEERSRAILSFSVSSMPAKGKLAEISRKKYGFRVDDRRRGLKQVLSASRPYLAPGALIKSDECPRYPKLIQKHFPHSKHETHKGRRGCVVGQGELKKIGFDPLFSLNHTCAMLRANINRLVRRTWCTTKKPERLSDHIALYVHYHNSPLGLG